MQFVSTSLPQVRSFLAPQLPPSDPSHEGPIDTPLLHDLLDATDVTVEEACEVVPMKRLGKAEEVASVVAFLLGPDSSYVTVRFSAASEG